MHELYDLKDNLMSELKKYSREDDLNANSLDVIEAITDTIKNLDKIIDHCEMEENGYSNASYGRYMPPYAYENGMNNNNMSNNSYARGRGRNARRDSMGRYSSMNGYSRADDNMITELSNLAMNAPDENTRQQIQAMIDRYR